MAKRRGAKGGYPIDAQDREFMKRGLLPRHSNQAGTREYPPPKGYNDTGDDDFYESDSLVASRKRKRNKR